MIEKNKMILIFMQTIFTGCTNMKCDPLPFGSKTTNKLLCLREKDKK